MEPHKQKQTRTFICDHCENVITTKRRPPTIAQLILGTKKETKI